MNCRECGRRTDDITDGYCWLCHYLRIWFTKAIAHTVPIR